MTRRLRDLAATAKTIREAAHDIIDLGHTRAIVHLDNLGLSAEVDTRYPAVRRGRPVVTVQTWEEYPAFHAVQPLDEDGAATVEGLVGGIEAAIRDLERARMIDRLRGIAEQEEAAAALHQAALARRAIAIQAALVRGVSAADAARVLGITRQRLGQIAKPSGSPQSHVVSDTAKLPLDWMIRGVPALPLDMEAALSLADEQKARLKEYSQWGAPIE